MATKPPTKPPRKSADSGSSATPPSARTAKKPVKRGPTRTEALKALGLTQEDLDTLKAVTTARAEAAEAPVHESPAPPALTPREQAIQTAKITAYNALKAAGATIPADLAAEVESIPEQRPTSDDIPNALKSAEERKNEAETAGIQMFARNLRGTDFGFRLSRQKTGKRTDLKPRGQRGDIVRLEKEDYGDPELERQIQYGCLEIITLAEAREIISKQARNQQQAVHPAMAMLRNELGKPYEHDTVKVAPEFNSQGITVAQLDPRQMRGELTDKEVAHGVGLQRVDNSQPAQQRIEHAPLGGNPAILNDGFAPRNDTAAQRDAIARQRNLEGPAAGGITRVVVDAPVKG
jgi:hypothetical protein